MPKIKVLIESFAGEKVCGEIISAAASASGKPATAAKITRDANGKLVSVEVGLPSGRVSVILLPLSCILSGAGVTP